jgi:patatin-like phospholipase/acyl hydrolase
LWGGGLRGHFTARVRERLEGEGPPLRERFDLIGGTSIGGILSLGLACGIPARILRQEIEKRGGDIFKPRRLSAGGWLRARYGAGPLEGAVRAILGDLAETAIAGLPTAVAVTSVDQTAGHHKVFLSTPAAPDGAGDMTVSSMWP